MFIFSGNLGKDAEVKALSSGKVVVEYSVAVYGGKDQQGNSQTLWIKCAHWFNQQPNDYLIPKKGDGVIIAATPAPLEVWTSNAGKQGADLKVMVNTIEYTKRGDNSGHAQAPVAPKTTAAVPPLTPSPAYAQAAAEDDDLPF